MFFFCPYLGREVDVTAGSWENIMPASLGGSSEFQVRVDREAHNLLAETVDVFVGPTSFVTRRTILDVIYHGPALSNAVTFGGATLSDDLSVLRFYSKLALGFGDWMWKRIWSSSAQAAALREILWSTTIEGAILRHSLWASADPEELGVGVEHDVHTFIIAPRLDGTWVMALFPFGGFGCCLKLGIGAMALSTPTTPKMVELNTRSAEMRQTVASPLR